MYPAEIVAKSSRPNNRCDAGGPKVEGARRGRNGGARRRRVGLGCVEARLLNVLIDRAQETPAVLIGQGQGLLNVEGKDEFLALNPSQMTQEFHTIRGNRRTSMS